jgi:hypothetical protein
MVVASSGASMQSSIAFKPSVKVTLKKTPAILLKEEAGSPKA